MRVADQHLDTQAATTAVLFDWNGTVVLDADRAQAALNDVLAARGLPTLDRTEFGREFHLPMASMFERLGVPVPLLEGAEAAWNHGMAVRPTRGRSGVDALRRLASGGIRLGIVSAAASASVTADIAGLGLDGLWSSIDAPARDKLEVLRARRGTAGEAFYVGDTAYDMRCATEAGYVAIGVTNGYTSVEMLEKAGATVIIDGFDDLERMLKAGGAAR